MIVQVPLSTPPPLVVLVTVTDWPTNAEKSWAVKVATPPLADEEIMGAVRPVQSPFPDGAHTVHGYGQLELREQRIGLLALLPGDQLRHVG